MAEQQVELHVVDPDPIAPRLDGVTSTVERWFASLEYLIEHGGDGFAGAHRWLVDHRPVDRGRSVCVTVISTPPTFSPTRTAT